MSKHTPEMPQEPVSAEDCIKQHGSRTLVDLDNRFSLTADSKLTESYYFIWKKLFCFRNQCY